MAAGKAGLARHTTRGPVDLHAKAQGRVEGRIAAHEKAGRVGCARGRGLCAIVLEGGIFCWRQAQQHTTVGRRRPRRPQRCLQAPTWALLRVGRFGWVGAAPPPPPGNAAAPFCPHYSVRAPFPPLRPRAPRGLFTPAQGSFRQPGTLLSNSSIPRQKNDPPAHPRVALLALVGFAPCCCWLRVSAKKGGLLLLP